MSVKLYVYVLLLYVLAVFDLGRFLCRDVDVLQVDVLNRHLRQSVEEHGAVGVAAHHVFDIYVIIRT